MKNLIVSVILLAGPAALACASNYDCDYGFQCMRPAFASEGMCMPKVDTGSAWQQQPQQQQRDTGGRACFTPMDCPGAQMCYGANAPYQTGICR